MNLWQPKIAPGDMTQPDPGADTIGLFRPFSYNLAKSSSDVEGVKITGGYVFVRADYWYVNAYDEMCVDDTGTHEAGELLSLVAPTHDGSAFTDGSRSGYFLPFAWADITATVGVWLSITRSADAASPNLPVITEVKFEVGEIPTAGGATEWATNGGGNLSDPYLTSYVLLGHLTAPFTQQFGSLLNINLEVIADSGIASIYWNEF